MYTVSVDHHKTLLPDVPGWESVGNEDDEMSAETTLRNHQGVCARRAGICHYTPGHPVIKATHPQATHTHHTTPPWAYHITQHHTTPLDFTLL